MKRHAKALVAVLIAMLCLGASAAFALQTHKPGTDVEAPPGGFGSLAGLATDSSSHQLYAADSGANRIERFSASGTFEEAWGWGVVKSGPDNVPTNEHQSVTIDATGGTFTLSYEGEPSAAITFNASAAEVQSALEAIAQIGAGNVSISGAGGGPYDIEFEGEKADKDISELSADATNLTGGAQSASVSTTAQGGAVFEVCKPADECQPGIPGNGVGQFNGPQDVTVDSSGDVFVADTNDNRIEAFDSSGAPLASFSGDGVLDGSGLPSPFSSFSSPCGLAVEPETGNLFLADQNNNRVWIFDPEGAFKGSVFDSTLSGPCGIAFSSNGEALFVRNLFNGRVLRFNRNSPTDFSFSFPIYSAEDGGYATDVAVSTTDDHVYVDKFDHITEYEQFGGEISNFGLGKFTSGFSQGIAADSASGKVYVADGSALRSFGPLVLLPDAKTGAASNVTGESATLKGTISAAEGTLASCSFEYDTTPYEGEASHGQSAPCVPAGPFSGSAANAVHADVSGLTPAAVYHFRLHATSSEGDSFGSDASFTTAGAPIVKSFFAGNVGASSAVLHATIDPAGASTSYRFEYTTQADFEANGFTGATKAPSPDGTLASPKGAQSVEETISGLEPGTEYAFRLLASNEVDTTETEAKSFTAFAASEPPTQGQFPGQGFLPDNRAWELVSPPDKIGSDVMAAGQRTRAAADGSAISFASLGGFADVRGFGVDSEYISERTAAPGTNGWAAHGITPPQQPVTLFGSFHSFQPLYRWDFSPDLDRGVFMAWSPLTDAPNVADLPSNLYLRDDLRSAGPGSYRLLSDAATKLSITLHDLIFGLPMSFDDASDDFDHIIFETLEPLTPGIPKSELGENDRLFKWDGGPLPRLITAGPGCPAGTNPASPCSAGGDGALGLHFTERTISADGSRVEFSSPIGPNRNLNEEPEGAVSRAFQLDDSGTQDPADDATIQLDASERSEPGFTRVARFQTASTDGRRVFFTSSEQLTEEPGSGLYMWQRQDEDEEQQLAVDATGGTFTLTAHSQPTRGRGNLASGSNEVSGVDAGSFMPGQTVSGPGIPPGTTIESMSGTNLILSKPATANVPGATIDADVEASTPPLSFDASAQEVQSALGALVQPMNPGEPDLPILGEGNISVGGGPGDAGATDPYTIAFTGALAGVNVMQLSADGSVLSGGASTASVATTNPVHNLSFLASTRTSISVAGSIGTASEDGHRLYFVTSGGQLVPGASPVEGHGVYYWQDLTGPPGGTLSFVGEVRQGDTQDLNTNISSPGFGSYAARVTPDGKELLVQLGDASHFGPQYDQSSACPVSQNCMQVYLYHPESSTPTEPDIVCASCDPSGAPATARASVNVRTGVGGAQEAFRTNHPLTTDGRYVFFSTAQRLVPEDTNGVSDAYEYDTLTGKQHLLSSGEDPDPSYFAEASANGHDAFIFTRQRLSGWDTDNNMDLYDARVDGGLPEPPAPPPSCQGDACQPEPAQLNDPTPASSSFKGAGNGRQPSPPRCRKGQRKVKARNGKTRCVGRHQQKNHKRAAKHNRRAGR